MSTWKQTGRNSSAAQYTKSPVDWLWAMGRTRSNFTRRTGGRTQIHTHTHTHRCMITSSRAILTGLGHIPCLPRVHVLWNWSSVCWLVSRARSLTARRSIRTDRTQIHRRRPTAVCRSRRRSFSSCPWPASRAERPPSTTAIVDQRRPVLDCF